MKIMVFDVPAQNSGALTILKDFFIYVSSRQYDDIKWIFIVSTDILDCQNCDNRIKIKKYPLIKKGWLYRIFFEIFKAPLIVKRYAPDVILSLQNTAILMTNIPQILYVHQAIPYSVKKFSFIKKDEQALALYSFIFRYLIGFSIKKASTTIVQTKWLRDAIIKSHNVDGSKIVVLPPTINFNDTEGSNEGKRSHKFFYPCTPFVYKNINIILDAVEKFKACESCPEILLTINGRENPYAKKIKKSVVKRGLSNMIIFIGRISREKVLSLYSISTLLFPSWLESYGLPLLEAKLMNSKIICADTPFAKEILCSYDKVVYHGVENADELYQEMKKAIEVDSGNSEFVLKRSRAMKEENNWEKLINLSKSVMQ